GSASTGTPDGVEPAGDRNVLAEVENADAAPTECGRECQCSELVAGTGRQADHHGHSTWCAARLEDRGEAATDGSARRMLGGDTDPTARPGIAEGRCGREEQVVDDGLVRARGQDLI